MIITLLLFDKIKYMLQSNTTIIKTIRELSPLIVAHVAAAFQINF